MCVLIPGYTSDVCVRAVKKSLTFRAFDAEHVTFEDVFDNNTHFSKARAYEHDVPAFSGSLKYLFTIAEVVNILYLSILLRTRNQR